MPGIKAKGVDNLIVTGVRFSNMDVGIQAIDSGVHASGNSFDNVRLPYDISESHGAISGTRITRDPNLRKGEKRTPKGWIRPNGPPLPAFCDKCGTVFPSHAYNLGGTLFALSINEETCPECGNEHAKLSEGVFNLAKDVAEILSAPDVTYEMFAQLRQLAGDLVDEKIAPAVTLEKIEAISPAMARIAKTGLITARAAGWLIGAVIASLTLYVANDANTINRTANTIAQQQVDISKAELIIKQEQWAAEKAKTINTDAVVTGALGILSNCRLTSDGQCKEDQTTAETSSQKKAKAQTTAKGGASKLKKHGKPKSRDMRREADKERRQAFGGSRHK